jgi:drug/metabolite transporter (DMT)-like permease
LSFWRVEKFMSQDIQSPDDPKVFTGAMMLAVATFAGVWSVHDFFLPSIDRGESITALLTSQLGAFSDWQVCGAILWTGIVTTALTSFGENIAMRRLSAAESTVIYSTEPLWGAAFAALVLGESLGWNTALGAVLILSACLWSSLGPELISASILSLGASATSIVGEETAEVIENLIENVSKFKFIADDTPL